MTFRSVLDAAKMYAAGGVSISGRKPSSTKDWAAITVANINAAMKRPELREQLRHLVEGVYVDRILKRVADAITREVLRNIEGRIAISLRSYGEKADYLKLGAITEEQQKRIGDFLMETIAPQLVEAFQMLQGGAT